MMNLQDKHGFSFGIQMKTVLNHFQIASKRFQSSALLSMNALSFDFKARWFSLYFIIRLTGDGK